MSVRTDLAAGDLRPLYLAWLAAYGTWERDEDAFDYDEGNDLEPPVPAGLGTLTASQRALADFLRLDTSLLTIAAQASLPLAETNDEPRKLAKWIKGLPAADKDTLLCRVAQGMASRSRWNYGAGSAVTWVLPATATRGAPWPNSSTQPPEHAINNL